MVGSMGVWERTRDDGAMDADSPACRHEKTEHFCVEKHLRSLGRVSDWVGRNQ